jgi:hypothetical protein
MKTIYKFHLNAGLKPTFNRFEQETGKTIDSCIQDFIDRELQQYKSEKDNAILSDRLPTELEQWLSEAIIPNQRYMKTALLEKARINVPIITDVSPKLFSLWLIRFASLSGFNPISGRVSEGAWFVLSDGSTKINKSQKPKPKEYKDFVKFAQKNLHFKKHIDSKDLYYSFLGPKPHIPQQKFRQWIHDYAISINYTDRWQKHYFSLLVGKV